MSAVPFAAERVGETNWYRAVRYTHTSNKWEAKSIEKALYGASGIILTPQKARRLLDAIRKQDLSFADAFTAFNSQWDFTNYHGWDRGICPSYVFHPLLLQFNPKFASTRCDSTTGACGPQQSL